jgi:hypothetical protein
MRKSGLWQKLYFVFGIQVKFMFSITMNRHQYVGYYLMM